MELRQWGWMALESWKEMRPRMYAHLEKTGMLKKAALRAQKMAETELGQRARSGEIVEIAREDVLRKYILLPDEETVPILPVDQMPFSQPEPKSSRTRRRTGPSELSGGKSLKSFPGGINEETYAKAKPHFEAMWDHAKKAGTSLKEFVEQIFDIFGDAIRPYLKRFLLEVTEPKSDQGPKENSGNEEKPTEKIVGGADAEKRKRRTRDNIQDRPGKDILGNRWDNR